MRALLKDAEAGNVPLPSAPAESDLRAPERLAIDYADAKDLAAKCTAALKALAANQPAMWKALRAQGIFRGQGSAPKVAFLYTGQGSQYVNMLGASGDGADRGGYLCRSRPCHDSLAGQAAVRLHLR